MQSDLSWNPKIHNCAVSTDSTQKTEVTWALYTSRDLNEKYRCPHRALYDCPAVSWVMSPAKWRTSPAGSTTMTSVSSAYRASSTCWKGVVDVSFSSKQRLERTVDFCPNWATYASMLRRVYVAVWSDDWILSARSNLGSWIKVVTLLRRHSWCVRTVNLR